ncbi:MAG: carotenoid biosynthesis protein [Ignavibacteriales bacterium]|nr:carotenoid biosynthesis protein [Ignavibacteriales bacterium]
MRSRALTALVVFYIVLWIGGVATYSISSAPSPGDGWTAAAFLWVAALISLLSAERTHALVLGCASVAAFMAEVLGVATGLVFGSYQYTGALGFALFNVPIAISAAWIILLAYVWHSTSRLKLGLVTRAILGAAWMTSIDLVIDPLAAGPLSYWHWQGGGWYYGIPLSNFAGWFGISLVLLLFLHQRPMNSAWAKKSGLSVIVFFTFVAAVNGLWLPALIGAALTMLDLGLFKDEWLHMATDAQSLVSQLQSRGLKHEG